MYGNRCSPSDPNGRAPAGPLPKAAALPECSAPGLPLAFRPPAASPPPGPRPQRLRSRPQTHVRQRKVPDILHPGAGIPMVRAEPFPPGCAPPSPPSWRRPRSRPRRRQSSLPSPTQPQTIPQTPSADFLHPETADPGPDPAAGGDRPAGSGRQPPRSGRRSVHPRSAVGDPRRRRAAPSPLPFREAAAHHGLRRPWSVTDSTCRPAPGRRRPGEPVRMLPRNQSREPATALGGRSLKAPDGRGPRRRLPRGRPVPPRGRSPSCVPASDRGRRFRPAGSSRDHPPRLRDRVGLLPEIPGQRSRVPELTEPHRPHPLSMAALPASPRTGPSRLRQLVRMAETDPPGAVRSVRPFRSHLGSQRSEAHPVPRPVNERRLAVKGRAVSSMNVMTTWQQREEPHAGRLPGLPIRLMDFRAARQSRPPDRFQPLPRPLPVRRLMLVGGLGPALHSGGPLDSSPTSPARTELRSSLAAALLNGPADSSRDAGRQTPPVRRSPCRSVQAGSVPGSHGSKHPRALSARRQTCVNTMNVGSLQAHSPYSIPSRATGQPPRPCSSRMATCTLHRASGPTAASRRPTLGAAIRGGRAAATPRSPPVSRTRRRAPASPRLRTSSGTTAVQCIRCPCSN